MRKKTFSAIAFALLVATSGVLADDPPAPKIEACPGGSCSTRNCKACCQSGQSPTCSWWACKCRPETIYTWGEGPGAIIDP